MVLLSWLTVFGMGFQAWLGATVVYSVLEPVKITLHMVMALVIVLWILYVIYLSKTKRQKITIPPLFRKLLIGALILTLVQIVLGTQVRQFVDEQIDLVGETSKNLWLAHPDFNFYFHRSFSILVFLINGFLFWNHRKKNLGLPKLNWVFFLIVLEVITGISMYYIDFPFGSQPLHLVFATLLFGFQVYLVIETKGKRNISGI